MSIYSQERKCLVELNILLKSQSIIFGIIYAFSKLNFIRELYSRCGQLIWPYSLWQFPDITITNMYFNYYQSPISHKNSSDTIEECVIFSFVAKLKICIFSVLQAWCWEDVHQWRARPWPWPGTRTRSQQDPQPGQVAAITPPGEVQS